jgi:hypothetical protein
MIFGSGKEYSESIACGNFQQERKKPAPFRR